MNAIRRRHDPDSTVIVVVVRMVTALLALVIAAPADQAGGALVTDWDHNGVVNSTDVSSFINSWFENTATPCGG